MVAPFPPRKGGVTVQTALLVRYLEQEGVKVLRVDTNLRSLRGRGLGPLRLAVQPWAVLFRLLSSVGKCDVVHFQSASYWGFMPTIIGAPIAKLFGKRMVISYQGGKGPEFIDRWGWLATMPFRLATVTAVCSGQLQSAFAERGIRTELVRNLFDAGLFLFRRRDRIAPRLVWTRSMEEIYDPFAAVKVYELVREQHPDASLVMTSDGSLGGPLRDYIRERGLSGVTLTGRIPTEDVARVMNEADICLNTSRVDGLPTALLEAAASGLPIVTTSAGGIPGLFDNGVSAVIVDIGDVQGLADAVMDLLSDPDKAKRLGEAARSVSKACTWDQVSGEVARIYGLTDGWPGKHKIEINTNAHASG